MCGTYTLHSKADMSGLPFNVYQSQCMTCGKPVRFTTKDGIKKEIMLETSTEHTNELDTPLQRIVLLQELLLVCKPTTTLQEILNDGNLHTSSTQYKWFDAMPKNKTLQWLIQMEKSLHTDTDKARERKKKNWDSIVRHCDSRQPSAMLHKRTCD